jgi:hypothetical protein
MGSGAVCGILKAHWFECLIGRNFFFQNGARATTGVGMSRMGGAGIITKSEEKYCNNLQLAVNSVSESRLMGKRPDWRNSDTNTNHPGFRPRCKIVYETPDECEC